MSRKYPTTVEEITSADLMRVSGFVAAKAPRYLFEDTRSEVTLELLKSLPNFDPDRGSLSGYLFNVARYRAIDYWRKEGKHDNTFNNLENNIEEDLTDVACLRQDKAIDFWAKAQKRWDHIERYEAEKKSKTGLVTHKGQGRAALRYVPAQSLANRRGNMPDPRHVGFPWE